jgi:RNA polymerase sigma-70 factor (ECF subfamily)
MGVIGHAGSVDRGSRHDPGAAVNRLAVWAVLHHVQVAVAQDFETMFRSEFPRLVSLGVAMCGRRDIAHELAQEAMLRAHRRWAEISTYESAAAWLRRVMVNLLIDHHRSRTAERAAVERVAAQPARSADSPTLDRWRELVGPLPTQQRAIVTLYYSDDQSVEAIADTLGISTGAVKASLFKARRSLERRLSGEVGDG